MYSFIHDDLFKIWLAESIEAGSRLVIAEHGGGLGFLLDLDRKHYSISQINLQNLQQHHFQKKIFKCVLS